MTPQAELVLAYLASAMLSLVSGTVLWLRRKTSAGAGSFALVLWLETWWSIAGIAELLSASLASKRFWDDAQLIPAIFVPPEMLFFALAYTGRKPKRPMLARLMVSLLPALCTLFVFTDAWHGLARPNAHIVPATPFDLLHYDFSSVEMITFAFCYAVIGVTAYLLIRRIATEHRVFRLQSAIALVAVLLPTATSSLALVDIRILGQRDVAPLVFGLSGILVTAAVGRGRFLDLVPIARDAVVESVSDAILLLDEKGRFVDANLAALELLGVPLKRLIGVDARQILPAFDAVLGARSREREAQIDLRLPTPIGERDFEALVSPVHDAPGSVLGTAVLLRDVTDRREASKALLRSAQRIESIGRMAGGVAHDFNNLLTAILCNVELIERRAKGDPKLLELLEPVKQAGASATELTHQLLAFSRNQITEPKPLDLDRSIQRVLRMLERILGEDVQLRFEPNAEDAHFSCDPVQLEQILLNLAVNARDALGAKGTITIRTERTHQTMPLRCTDRTVLEPGDYVTLSVSDTGSGIPADILEKMFDPFFTTKPVGLGTGLGLALVRDITRQHDGHVEVETQLGVGTTFRVHFPEVAPPLSAARPSRAPSEPPGGTETILVIEDQALVRETVTRTLAGLDYRVFACASVKSGLDEAAKHPDALDLLVTDVVLADGSGRKLAEQLRARTPRLRVLYISGYTDDVVLRHGIAQGEIQYLAKPFTERQLAEAVRRALDRQAAQ